MRAQTFDHAFYMELTRVRLQKYRCFISRQNMYQLHVSNSVTSICS